MDRESLLLKLSELEFAAYDLRLYLNTHPRDRRALAEFAALNRQAETVRNEFEKNFGPLTAASNRDENHFTWIDQPWPWERGFYAQSV